MRLKSVATALLGLLLVACTGTQVRNGGGDTIAEVLAQPYDGPQKRMVIAPLRDHSSGEESIKTQLLLLDSDEPPTAKSILGGIHELLSDALFNSGRFILLEREGLQALIEEQDFDAPLSGEQQATLEGAELLLLGAVTAFDSGSSGGIAFPIPIRLGDDDFGILDVEMRTAYVAMDLRLVDVKTGRVVATSAVEGRSRKFGIAMTKLYRIGGGSLRLPGLLSYYQNTPMEKAIMKMTLAATQSLVETVDPEAARQRKEMEFEEVFP